jgi:hypothetical protein
MNVILPSILLPINEKYINKMIFEEQTVGGRKDAKKKVMNHLTTKVFAPCALSVRHLVD